LDKIYITGCARSGTTLLLRLFYSFNNVDIIDKEINLQNFCSINSDKVLVGKRSINTIFSNILNKEDLDNQIKIIKDNNIKIINITRKGLDVIESGKTSPERWIESIRQKIIYKDLIKFNIDFNDLVSQSNIIQEYISFIFDLTIKYKFSEYPEFLPNNLVWNKEAYRPRPITTENINKVYDWESRIDKNTFLELCKGDKYVKTNPGNWS
jgi:hypothetical protein